MSALDPTFRNYSAQQAASYDVHRGSYSALLYDHIVNFHGMLDNNGFGDLLDVGCGTGSATCGLAIYFDRATGLDPSTEMVAQAVKHGDQTILGNGIRYEVADAENLLEVKSLHPDSIDLISSGMAAHWFDMAKFWPQAAKVLKHGGTVALWTQSSLYCHPSTPNAAAVQEALSHLEDDILGPFELPSNRLSRTMYDDLTLPWQCNPAVAEFPEQAFVKLEWNRNGQLEAGQSDFFGGSDEVSLLELEGSLGTASMVTRWRAANPEKVGTEGDCVKQTIRKIARAMGVEAEDPSKVKVKVASSTALLLFARTGYHRKN